MLQLHPAATVPTAAVLMLKAPHGPQAAWPPLPLQAASSKAAPPVLLIDDATTVPDDAAHLLVIEEEEEQQQIVDKLAEKQKAAEKNVKNLIEAVEGAAKKMDEMMTKKVEHLHAALVIHHGVLDGVAEQTRALQALLPEGKQIIGRCHAAICDAEDKLAEKQKAAEKNVKNLIEAVEGAVKKMDEMMAEKVEHLHAALVIHNEVLNGVAEQTRALQALLPEGKQIIGRYHAAICDEEQQVHATFRKEKMFFDSEKEEAMMMIKEVVIQTYEEAKQEFEERTKMVIEKVLIAELQRFFATQEEVQPHAPEHPPIWKAEPGSKTWTGSVSGATPSATALLQALTHMHPPWSQRRKLPADACGEEAKEGEERKKEEEEEEEEETGAESGIIGVFIPPALHQAAQPQKTVDATSFELVHGLAANNAKLEAIIGSLAVIQETHAKLIQQQSDIHGILHAAVEELKEQGGRLDDLASQHQRSGGSHGCSSRDGSGSFKMVALPGDQESSLSHTQSSNGTV